MERSEQKQEILTRLVLCVGGALVLWYGAEPACTALKLSLWEERGPWLKEHRTAAVAAAAAVLFVLSLAVLPLKKEEDEVTAPDGFEACG